MLVPLYIPNKNTSSKDNPADRIAPGSAIVGEGDVVLGRMTLDYEGNLFGAVNMRRYVERCVVAWERHADNAPTLARAYLPEWSVIMVAVFDTDSRSVLVKPIDYEKLAAWLGVEDIDTKELVL